MSETAPVRGIVVGHGALPDGMVDAVRSITGCDPDALVPITNRGMSPESLADAVLGAVGDAEAILFTDLQSGSCGFVARRVQQSNPQLIVISAVNLPMLIDFAMNRGLPLTELVPRLLSRGRAAIRCAPAHLDNNEHRALSN